MWSSRLRYLVVAAVAAAVVGTTQGVSAQFDNLPYMLKYNRGQNVQPIFQGWSRNSDGSFEMHLGYLNRNYVEELHVPIGPNNNIEPGGPDHGQPTYFYTRVNRQIFSVTVPADWGDERLVWTLTVHGKTQQAVAWLQPEWEIDPVTGGRNPSAEAARNQPPTISVDAPGTVALPATMTLTATVSDDGLPTPGESQARPRAIGQETPPLLQAQPGAPEAPKNVPHLQVSARGRQERPQPPHGLSVSYQVWRGPAGVVFEPAFSEVQDGAAVTTATFSVPGRYVLRAQAADGRLNISAAGNRSGDAKSTEVDVSLTVSGAASAAQP